MFSSLELLYYSLHETANKLDTCHHLFTITLFQTRMTFFSGTQENILSNAVVSPYNGSEWGVKLSINQ